MNTPITLQTLVAAVAIAALAPLQAAQGDDLLNRAVEQFSSLEKRGAWINPYLPVSEEPSADSRMQTVVDGFTRTVLDRGGWSNLHVPGDHYAAGEPLLAAAIGGGVTTRSDIAREPVRYLAAR